MGHEFNVEVIFLKTICPVLVTINCCCHFHTLVSVVCNLNAFLYYLGFMVFLLIGCIVKMWICLICSCTLIILDQITKF